jgi:biopolymer transport protein ExbD
MAMNVGPSSGEDEVVATINTTPLVDVMLVLLIIFLITIPVVTHVARQTKPENIELAVTRDGDVYWNTTLVPDTATLVAQLKTISVKDPQPEVHIRGDEKARYESVGRVLVASQRAGIAKISFVTEPPARGG